MRRAFAGALALLAVGLGACDHGAQPLAWERGGEGGATTADTYAPWYGGPDYYARWPRGYPSGPDAFPIGVWMQRPENAARFAEVGVNLYVGLWEGPTEEQLTTLGEMGMATACEATGVWEDHLEDDTIRAWLLAQGPDNAQELADGSYGPCVEPSVVQADAERVRATDSSRPLLLAFGRGAAVTDWEGRGVCTERTDMYPEYAAAGDVLGYWVYPVNQGDPLEVVADGADNVQRWSSYEKPVIATLEASSFDGVTRPTPTELRAELWMALIHGVAGVEYYCHGWQPVETDVDCLDHAPTAAALAAQTQQVRELAPVLNSPTITNGHTVEVTPAGARVDTALKRHGGATYLFAVALGGLGVHATFSLARLPGARSAEVLGEARELEVVDGELSDDFEPYAVHLYRVSE